MTPEAGANTASVNKSNERKTTSKEIVEFACGVTASETKVRVVIYFGADFPMTGSSSRSLPGLNAIQILVPAAVSLALAFSPRTEPHLSSYDSLLWEREFSRC